MIYSIFFDSCILVSFRGYIEIYITHKEYTLLSYPSVCLPNGFLLLTRYSSAIRHNVELLRDKICLKCFWYIRRAL